MKRYESFLGNNIFLSIMFLGKTMNTIKTQFKNKIDDMIDSLASIGIRLIRPKENYHEDLAILEWKIKPIREEIRTIVPSNYSTFQNRDNRLYIKFKNYMEEPISKP